MKGENLIKGLACEIVARDTRVGALPGSRVSTRPGKVLGKVTLLLREAESTNDLAVELAEKGSPHGTVVVAETQSGGKGRHGRRWASPPGGNIYMSVLLWPAMSQKDAPILTLLASVSAANALRCLTGVDVRIKWPNDLVCGGKKLGGILAEMRTAENEEKGFFCVIGIGINVNKTPPEVEDIATSVFDETGRKFQRSPIVEAILDEMEKELDGLKTGDAPLLDKWRALSNTLGKSVTVKSVNKTLTGFAEDIDDKGRLLLRTDSGLLMKISSGDVTLMRQG